jgi:hypothetical protein
MGGCDEGNNSAETPIYYWRFAKLARIVLVMPENSAGKNLVLSEYIPRGVKSDLRPACI